MAEVNANSLPAKTDLGTNDSAIVVDQTTNAGALVDLDVLADKVLDRISSKTFANQVGGSSAATLLAQLSTLNSNLYHKGLWYKGTTTGATAVTIDFDLSVSATYLILIGQHEYGWLSGETNMYTYHSFGESSSTTARTSTVSKTISGVTVAKTNTSMTFTMPYSSNWCFMILPISENSYTPAST